jgi:hypothetical protein
MTARDFNLNLANHATLFDHNDNASITRLFEANGGRSENNTYLNSIIQTLNDSRFYTEGDQRLIRMMGEWVNQNGATIGITRTDNGYELAR